ASAPWATNPMSILPRESLVTSIGFARNRTFAITSARQPKFCGTKESCTKCKKQGDENLRRDRFQRAGAGLCAARFSLARSGCQRRENARNHPARRRRRAGHFLLRCR